MYHYIFKYFIVPVLGKKGLKGYEEFLEFKDIHSSYDRKWKGLTEDVGKFLKKCDINLLKENELIDDNELLTPVDYLWDLECLSIRDEEPDFCKLVDFLKFFKDFVKVKGIKNLKDIEIKEYFLWLKENLKNGKIKKLKNVKNLKRETKKLLKLRIEFKEEYLECYKKQIGWYPTAHYEEMLVKNFVRSHQDLDVRKYVRTSFDSDAVKKGQVTNITVNLLVSNKWFDYIQTLMTQKDSNNKIEVKYL